MKLLKTLITIVFVSALSFSINAKEIKFNAEEIEILKEENLHEMLYQLYQDY